MQKNKINFFSVHTNKLAGFLMVNGFVLMDIRENEFKKGKHVYYFKKSTELDKCVDKYFNQNKF